MSNSAKLYVGLLSGTSIDGIDCALLRCEASTCELIATHQHPFSEQAREDIAAISVSGANEIERMGKLDREIAHWFADATLSLLAQQKLEPTAIRAIGSHGQTIRHRPPSDGSHSPDHSFTLQIGDPNTLAERTGITTVADFRRRDIAAGGEGAPLAPAFHAAVFSHPQHVRAIVNIGGIANISILRGTELAAGFDSGPGNTLLDQWIGQHLGQSYDKDGAWGAQGQVNSALLQRLLQHPYLQKQGVRSTGKEAFNLAWLDETLGSEKLAPADVQATLTQLTAQTIAETMRQADAGVDQVFICGGGAHNRHLMQRLGEQLLGCEIQTTQALGLHPDWVEAAAFAWMAHRTLEHLPSNAPVVTGARGHRILGGIYPA